MMLHVLRPMYHAMPVNKVSSSQCIGILNFKVITCVKAQLKVVSYTASHTGIIVLSCRIGNSRVNSLGPVDNIILTLDI